jgi:cytochrome c
MRRPALVLAAVSLAALLSACGKSQTGQSGQTAASGQPSTPVAEPTDAEKKALVATLPAPYSGGDIANGETKFAVCKSCHTLGQGGPNLTGPNLFGIFDRKAGTLAGFNYSDAMKAQSFAWDPQHLDSWLTDPKAMVPNTKMTFPGYKDPKDRIDVIAYLKAETSGKPVS